MNGRSKTSPTSSVAVSLENTARDCWNGGGVKVDKLIGNVSRENLYPTDSLHVARVLVGDQDMILDKERLVRASTCGTFRLRLGACKDEKL